MCVCSYYRLEGREGKKAKTVVKLVRSLSVGGAPFQGIVITRIRRRSEDE